MEIKGAGVHPKKLMRSKLLLEYTMRTRKVNKTKEYSGSASIDGYKHNIVLINIFLSFKKKATKSYLALEKFWLILAVSSSYLFLKLSALTYLHTMFDNIIKSRTCR